MNNDFECRLCKNTKRIQERAFVLFWSPYENNMIMGAVCRICFYKLIRITNSHKVNDEDKQKVKDQWKLDLYV